MEFKQNMKGLIVVYQFLFFLFYIDIWELLRTIIQNFIPHIFKTLIIVELNSQLTCNNGIITYKCITYSINNQHTVSLSAISYFNDLR